MNDPLADMRSTDPGCFGPWWNLRYDITHPMVMRHRRVGNPAMFVREWCWRRRWF